MNITTGINRITGDYRLWLMGWLIISITSCQPVVSEQTGVQAPPPEVQVVNPVKGDISSSGRVTGLVVSMHEAAVTSPADGMVTSVAVNIGDHVTRGDLLFVIRTREGLVMEQQEGTGSAVGVIPVKAPVTGVITRLDVPDQNVYVSTGSPMAVIVPESDRVVMASVPWDQQAAMQAGGEVTIVLPDGASLAGEVITLMPVVDPATQTRQVMIRTQRTDLLVLNLQVFVDYTDQVHHDTWLLPPAAMLTNETRDHWWIMAVNNDGLAFEIPVVPGLSNDHYTEVLGGDLSTDLRVITEGAYGLPDSTQVRISAL